MRTLKLRETRQLGQGPTGSWFTVQQDGFCCGSMNSKLMTSNRGHASSSASVEILALLSRSMGRRLTNTTRQNPRKRFTSFPLWELHQVLSLGGTLQDRENRPVLFPLLFLQRLDTWLPTSPFVSGRQHPKKDTKAPYFSVKKKKKSKLDFQCLWVE